VGRSQTHSARARTRSRPARIDPGRTVGGAGPIRAARTEVDPAKTRAVRNRHRHGDASPFGSDSRDPACGIDESGPDHRGRSGSRDSGPGEIVGVVWAARGTVRTRWLLQPLVIGFAWIRNLFSYLAGSR